MYEKLPNLVIGFHGCNKDTFDQVIINHKELKASVINNIISGNNYEGILTGAKQ